MISFIFFLHFIPLAKAILYQTERERERGGRVEREERECVFVRERNRERKRYQQKVPLL